MNIIPSISVVIPTYNRATELRRALQSVRDQTFQPTQVLVCDDGSTDETQGVIREFEGKLPLQYVWRPNSGLPAAMRNLGIRMATGEFVAFLDSDDWWTPVKIQRSVEAGLIDLDVVYHPLHKAPKLSKFSYGRMARSRDLRRPVLDDLLNRGNVIPNSSAIIRKSIVIKIGGVNESRQVRSWEDYDLWLRTALVTERFHYLDEVLGFYSTGEGLSSPVQSLKNLENFSRIWCSDRKVQPAWIRQQRALALAELGKHRSAFVQACLALANPSTLRFRSDFVMGVGLCGREAVKVLRG